MRLSARMLENVGSVNAWENTQQVRFFQGDGPAIYFQLIDLNHDRAEQGFSPAGRRYVPSAGATLFVVLDNIDDARKVTRAASQPFAQDPSIWMIQLLATDTCRGTVNLKLTLLEGSVTTHGFLSAAIGVEAGSNLDSSIGWTGGTL